jgi:hypothetical protein
MLSILLGVDFVNRQSQMFSLEPWLPPAADCFANRPAGEESSKAVLITPQHGDIDILMFAGTASAMKIESPTSRDPPRLGVGAEKSANGT